MTRTRRTSTWPAPAALNALRLAVLCVSLAAVFAAFDSRPLYAACCSPACAVAEHNATRNKINEEHYKTRRHMTQEMMYHQYWWFTDFFNQHILPAEMMMAEQLTAVGMQQMEIVGAMIDAKHQLESQRLFEQLKAESHKDYHSSTGMCTIATTVRGLSSTDRRAETTAFIIAQRSLDRQLGNANVSAVDGEVYDRASRIEQFLRRYCEIEDNNRELKVWCNNSAPSETANKDVDYNRLVETPLTIDVDFTDGTTAEGDEEDIFALASNLFSHDIFYRMSETDSALLANNAYYYDLRSVVAKRSVAENSIYNIIGMKARGSEKAEETVGHVGVILKQLGVPDDEIFKIIGNRPSYFALMDVMAQKLYQRPEFYTELYDKPANVLRKDASMRAIDLMVDRDIYKSELRSEAMLAVLLELELVKYQDTVVNRAADTTEQGKKQ